MNLLLTPQMSKLSGILFRASVVIQVSQLPKIPLTHRNRLIVQGLLVIGSLVTWTIGHI